MTDPVVTLLDVQDRDLVADQLRHRRASLPERLELAETEAALAGVDVELAEVGERLAELQRAQKRLEDEIASLEAKGESENKKLYSGTVTSPRELQAIQEEVEGIVRRQRQLEDDLLEIMEAVEPVADERDALEARREQLASHADELRHRAAEVESALDAELASVLDERATVAAGVPPDLLATYERLRDRLGGVGAARLEGAQCLGCHLTLPAVELDAVRHAAPGVLVFHEECGRILVRAT